MTQTAAALQGGNSFAGSVFLELKKFKGVFPPLPLLEFWSEAPDYKCVIATCAIFSSSSLPESRDWGSFPSKARQETDNERRL